MIATSNTTIITDTATQRWATSPDRVRCGVRAHPPCDLRDQLKRSNNPGSKTGWTRYRGLATAADIGGLDIPNNFCGPIYTAQAIALDPNNAFSLVCVRNDQRAALADMNRVCINQYGVGAFALATNVFNAGSWRCYR